MKTFYITSLLLVFVMSGCSNFRFNATICNQIASEPNAQIPGECRVYNEEEAAKAFDNANKKSFDSNESVEFSK
jgi:hypothetical protein